MSHTPTFCCFLFSSWLFCTVCSAADSLPALKKSSQKLASDVLNVEALQEAAKVCEKILESKGNDFETLILFSHVCWSLGNHQAEARDDRKMAEKLIKKLDKKDDRFPEQKSITGR